jgi:hypothetical protein
LADDVPEEEVPLESFAAAALPHEQLLGRRENTAAATGAGAPALCMLPAPPLRINRNGGHVKPWLESVFCEGTVTTGVSSPLPAALEVTPWTPDAIPAPVAMLSRAVVDAAFAGFGGIPTT